MKTIRAVSTVGLVLVLSVWVCGCGLTNDSARVTKEYNDSIVLYNRMSIAFSNLARFVDDNVSAPEGFERDFWESYDSRKKKVLERMALMEQHEFQYREIREIRTFIQTLMDDMEEYMQFVDGYRGDEGCAEAEEFVNRHRELYNGILARTSEIVITFENVYDRIF